MTRIRNSPKLSPAERAHLIVLAQEARRERIMRLIERALREREVCEECMSGEVYYKPRVLHHHGTQWECAALARLNRTRPASRICHQLPPSAYEGKRHVR